MPNLTNYEYDIFLSHNHADHEWTARLAERLEQESWRGRKLKVFFSPWDIRPGQSIPKEIEKGLARSRKVGLIMSPDAVNSAWVELERLVTTYIAVSARDERLIPLYRRDCEIPALLRPVLYVDFRDDAKFEASSQTLLSVIREEPLPRRSVTLPGNLTALHDLIPRPPIVGFVARRDGEGHDIVERLKEELSPQKNQLIALSGPGGVGKSTLAAESARALTASFEQRVVWISAVGREDFALATLLDEIATQLGHAELGPLTLEPKTAQVQALIGEAATLIVLDNFETIAEAEQTRCVEFLLNRASCPVLITTRGKIASARHISIPVMFPEEATTFLQLLIEESNDPPAFAQIDRSRIVAASERNPLVLQWVVGQIGLAQEADTVLDELAQGTGDAAQRVFDRSFGLAQLGNDGRAALLALSLFAPDASRAALAAAAGFGQDLKRLNEAVKRLAGLWLIKALATGSRISVAGLTRELAKARLSRDDCAKQYRQQFIGHFADHVERRSQPIPEDYDSLEAEKDNLIIATDLAAGLADWESILRIAAVVAAPVTGVLAIRGYWNDCVKLSTQAVEAAHRSKSESAVAAYTHNLALMLSLQGELDEARRLYHESLEIKKRLGNQGGIASSLHQLARLAQDQGELDEARRLYHQSLEIDKRLGNQGGIARSLHNLASLAQNQGELDEARRLYHESLEIKKRLGNQRGIANSLHQLALLAHDQGQLDEARRLYHESLEIDKRLGNQGGIARSLHSLASLAQDQGELDEARRLYHESLEIKKRLGNQGGIASSLHQLGTLAEDGGNKAEAAQLFSEALEIFERLKSPNAAIARRSLARVQGESS